MSSISYTLRKKDLLEFNDYHARRHTDYGKNLSRHKVLWPGVIVILALFIVLSIGNVLIGALLMLAAFAWSWLAPRMISKRLHRHIIEQLPEAGVKASIGDYRLTVTPKGLLENNAHGEKLIKWKEIQRVETFKQHAYFYLSEASAIIIPKKMIVEQDDFNAFHDDVIKAIKLSSESPA